MGKNLSGSIINKVKEILRPEKKKLILPVLLILILAGSTFYTLNFRDSPHFEKYTSSDKNISLKYQKLFMDRDYYPNESGIETESDFEKRSEEIRKQRYDFDEIKKDVGPQIYLIYPLFRATESDLVPFLPSLTQTISGKLSYYEILFNREKGYTMSKKFEKTNVESVYINVKGFELRKKLNSTNTSYEEFKKELDKIGSKSYENRDVRQLFYNKTDNLDKDNRKRIRDDELKNLQFYHFIPAFIANFLVYYLFSGIVLTGWRDFKSDVEKLSEHKHFFLSNLFLSAIAATLINFTIMAIGSETGIINSFNPKYLILGSLLWIPIFGAVANEIRKKTKYAWLVTGITLNIIIVAIRFDHQSIYTDILIDEIPFYLTVLGIISQYGLFHGEKHLRKMIIRNPTSQ